MQASHGSTGTYLPRYIQSNFQIGEEKLILKGVGGLIRIRVPFLIRIRIYAAKKRLSSSIEKNKFQSAFENVSEESLPRPQQTIWK